MTDSTPQLVIAEIRRQVDHQIRAAEAIDTRAAALITGTFVVAGLVAPRVDTDTAGVIGLLTLALVLVTLFSFLQALRVRLEAFSYGPDATQMLAFVDDGDPPAVLERAMAKAYVEVRKMNEATLKSKGEWMVAGVVSLVATVIALGVLLMAGGIE